MNPNETTMSTTAAATTTTGHSLHKRIIEPGADDSNGSSSCDSNSLFSLVTSKSLFENKDQNFLGPPLYADKAFIKQVIGTGYGGVNSNTNQNLHSILKKNAPAALLTSSTFTPSSTVKANAWSKPDTSATTTTAVVKSQQQPASSTSSSDQQKQHQILIAPLTAPNTSASTGHVIKLITPVTPITLPGLSDKHTVVKRPLPMVQHQVFPTPTSSIALALPSSHVIYKTMNGNSTANCTEIYTTSLLAKPAAAKLTNRRQSYRDVQILTGAQQLTNRRSSIQIVPAKPMDIKPTTIIKSIQNKPDITAPAEVTQISSTVTLTKSIPTKTTDTIEKKQSNTSLLNGPKQERSVNAVDKSSSSPESGQKSLLIKPTSQAAIKTASKQQSLLKVNSSLSRVLNTSPRTKRSKSLTLVGNPIKKRGRPRRNRRLSTASDGELLQKAVEQLTLEPSIEETKPTKEPSPEVDISSSAAAANSLLCNDKIEKIPSSNSSSNSSTNSNLELSPHKDAKPSILKTTDKTYFNSTHMNMVLGMLSTFNMLTWKERVGFCKKSEMKFQLNELNLVQIAEKCHQRDKMNTAYEKPIFERDSTVKTKDYSDALYCCRRCECHGAAVDFLSPEFCSYDCFRRESRKRSKITIDSREHEVRERFKKNKNLSGSEIVSPEIKLIPKRFFTWGSHLNATNSEPAPVDLFPNPYPCGENLFEVGMKLEAIDPEHNSLFCVCTVVEKKGYRLKLNFDGYSNIYNFWVNADSMDIFPPGWCSKTNRLLQPPKGINILAFNWPMYLANTKSVPALRSMFTHLNSCFKRNPFKVGMRLEAIDLKNTGKMCVASVADVLDNRILVHFDGWDESYDYWIEIDSPYIHPIGYHKQNNYDLIPPPDWDEFFDWQEYLEFMRCEAASPSMFYRRDPIEFNAGMKMEVVDFKNPCYIRPATVVCRDGYKVLVHLDGWPSMFAYWVNDDSPDIHPIRWAEKTGHDLEPPPGYEQLKKVMPCPVNGCRGIGHAKRNDVFYHANRDTCPYEERHWNNEVEKPSRIDEIARLTVEEKILIKQDIEQKSSEPPEIPKTQKESVKKQPTRPAADKKNTTPAITSKSPHSKEEKQQKRQIQQEDKEKDPNIWEKEIKISKEYLCDYGPRLKQNYKIFKENGSFNSNSITKNPLEWTTDETAHYISTKCHPIGHLFKSEDIDGAALLSMHQSDLTDILNLKLGPSVKIFAHILHLRQQVVSRFIK